jgi:hypothetical protein
MSMSREVEKALDNLPKGVHVETVDNDALKRWRRGESAARRKGRRRTAIVGMADPNDATRGKSEPVVQDDAGGYRLSREPDPIRKAEPRELIEDYQAKLMAWATADKAMYLSRARMLRETSPLQFSHLTDEQLAEQLQHHMLAELAREKARAAVERNAHRLGFDGAMDLSLVGAGKQTGPVYLPGQTGRVPSD